MRISRIVVVVLALFVAGSGLAAAAGGGADAILGLWATDPEDKGGMSHISIEKTGGRYAGTIVWLEEPRYPEGSDAGPPGQEKTDRENPDKTKRSQPILGLEIMRGFQYEGKNRWEGGTIYDPNNGKTYKCKIRLGDNGELHVRGFIGFSLIGRTTVWTRPEKPTPED